MSRGMPPETTDQPPRQTQDAFSDRQFANTIRSDGTQPLAKETDRSKRSDANNVPSINTEGHPGDGEQADQAGKQTKSTKHDQADREQPQERPSHQDAVVRTPASEATSTPASDAAAKFKELTGVDALAKGVIPGTKTFLDGLPPVVDFGSVKGYAYRTSHDIGKVTDFTTAKTAMSMLKNEPNRFFPFEIRGEDGSTNVMIREGARLDLVGPRESGLRADLKLGPLRVGGGNPVVVEHVTDTQFTFRTGAGHFDGKDNLISFRTYESEGRIRLEQTAWAPNAGPLNARFSADAAKRFTWPAQADNLRNAILAADPILQSRPW